MSVIRPKPPEDPIEYEPAAVVASADGSREAHAAVEQVRRDVLAAVDAVRPDQLLEAYNTDNARAHSELFEVLQAARRIRDTVDRVVVVGDGCGAIGARAIFESCAHPCHNELSRGERGGRPRLSFVGSALDHDALQGLLDLVVPAGKPRGSDLLDQWAVIMADSAGDGVGTAAAARLLLASLLESLGGDRAAFADRVVPMTSPTGGSTKWFASLGCTKVFTVPDAVGAAGAVFTPLGLLPAAVVGIDVVRLLQGAAAMNRRFREAPITGNPVLQFAAATRRMAEQGGMTRVFASPSSQLDAVCRWHGRLSAHRGPHLTTDLIVREPRRDPLVVPTLTGGAANADGLDDLAGAAWPERLAARRSDARSSSPADAIVLPRVDEHSIGQLLQFLVLASLVE